MKARRVLLRPGQAAWLAEIGVDTHWLGVTPVRTPDGAAPGAAAGGLAKVVSDAVPAGKSEEAPGELADRAPAAARIAPSAEPRGAGRESAVAATDCHDLAALAAAVQACRRCALHGQRTHAVPGAGVAQHPRYFIVGEQPGIEDDARGQPFQGDQGLLLDAMLAAVRLPQADSAWRTHVVKCRAVGGKEPADHEIASCLAWLHREIELLQPQWILALGRVAARAVLGSSADLDALRGGPHRYVSPQGREIPVWVTHQPASLLVRSDRKAEAWRDLLALAQAVRAGASPAGSDGR